MEVILFALIHCHIYCDVCNLVLDIQMRLSNRQRVDEKEAEGTNRL